jgi:hypothetical protein
MDPRLRGDDNFHSPSVLSVSSVVKMADLTARAGAGGQNVGGVLTQMMLAAPRPMLR